MDWESGAHTLSRVAESDRVPPGQLLAQIEANEMLSSRLLGAGVEVTPNSGRGNLCMLQSMLQWAGVPPEEVDERAFEMHAELSCRPDALGAALRAGQGLYADREVLQALAEHIFGPGNVPPVLIMTAGAQGLPQLYAPLSDHAGAAVDLAALTHHTAVFLETPGHFNALANTSGRPWPAVLQQLQMAHGEPAQASAAWMEQVVRAAHPLTFQTVAADGTNQTHTCKRGVQTGLTVLHMGAQALNPLQQAQAMAEAQGVVDDFWSALQNWDAFDLGQMPLDGGGQLHRLGISPLSDYQDALPKDSAGVVNFVALQTGESAFQYIAELQIRQDRLLGLTLRTSGEGDIAVDLDHPWSRPHVDQGPARALLTHADDLDAFDEFAPRAIAAGQRADPVYFAEFLLDLRQHGGGMGWEEFRDTLETERDRYLRDATADGRLKRNTPAVVRRAIDPQRTVQRRETRSARASLTHAEDLAAFDEFAARAIGQVDPWRCAIFLTDLRQHGGGMGWEEFSHTLEPERERYMRDAVAGGLDECVPPVVRRMIDPQRTLGQIASESRKSLTHAEDLVAFDEFARRTIAAGQRDDPARFAEFLLHLRQHGGGMGWEEFRDTLETERNRYLRDAVADGSLNKNTPAAVRRAIPRM